MVRLESFYISEDFRKKGIGEKLYTAFVDWVKKKGVRNISVEITTANKGAESFYKKNGFRDYNSTLEVEL
jgi:GNAT superfamily N-acetyltransferase